MTTWLEIVYVLIVLIVIIVLLKVLLGVFALIPFELNPHQEANILSSLLPSNTS